MSDSAPVRSAVLVGYPLRLWQRQQMHNADVLREFELLLIGHQVTPSSAPARLLQVATAIVGRYGSLVDAIQLERQAAFERGEATIDSRIPLVPDTVPLLQAYGAAFDEVDAFCRDGSLLALPTPPDLVALRTWSLGEVLAQHDGAAPTPWTGPLG